MIAYVTVGADDIARAKRFYSAFLPALDYGLKEGPEGLSYALPEQPGQSVALPDFYVKPTFDGHPTSAGNGAMIAFEARSQKQVRDLHAAALDAGGLDEGQPGFRDSYGPRFYVGYLHNPSLSAWLKSYKLSRENFVSDREALRAIFDAARKRGTGNTGIFGLRMQRGSFNFFMQQVGALHPELDNDIDRIHAVFGHTQFIHLTRQNKLNQAISRVKATQTGLWHRAADGTELERQSPPREPFYNADEIERTVEELTVLNDSWKHWFSREKIKHLTVTYNELSADPVVVLSRILDQLGLNREMASDIKPSVAKLANATNRIWAERFQTERSYYQN